MSLSSHTRELKKMMVSTDTGASDCVLSPGEGGERVGVVMEDKLRAWPVDKDCCWCACASVRGIGGPLVLR